jgi:hypothetical protein
LVGFAKRPLSLKEVEEALAISKKPWQGLGQTYHHCSDLLPHEITKLDGTAIHRLLAPFLILQTSPRTSDGQILRLRHASVYTFLRDKLTETSSYIKDSMISHDFMAEVCMKYLSQKRYADMHIQSVKGHSFFMYAAKHWHRHVQESSSDNLRLAGSFIQSPQFLVLAKLQSLYLDRHFSHRIKNENESSRATMNIPKASVEKNSITHTFDDTAYFFDEWAEFLRRGVTNLKSRGDIGKCFGGVLSTRSPLQKSLSRIQKQESFLLEMITSSSHVDTQSELQDSLFYQAISQDGSRVAVWQMPIYQYDIQKHKLNDMQLT